MKKQIGVALLVLLAVAAALGFYYWPFQNGHALRLPGIVEIQEVRLGSKLGGRVADVLVAEGQEIHPGDRLVILEAPELEKQRDQLKAKLDAAEAELLKAQRGARVEEKAAAKAAAEAAKSRYDKIKEGWRIEEKDYAAAELASAQAELKLTEQEFQRVADLYRGRSAAKADYDAAMSARDRARGRVNAARSRVEMMEAGSRKQEIAEAESEWRKLQAQSDLLENGTRPEDIDLARAQVEEIKAKLQEVDVNLREAVVRAPYKLGKGLVEVLMVRPGDLVAPNQPVVKVLRVEDLWVKVFVPETKLGLVPVGKDVSVTIDTFPDRPLRGVVVMRGSAAEFTPRNVQSIDERRFQVFGVKIRVDDPKGILNSGMAAEVTIPID